MSLTSGDKETPTDSEKEPESNQKPDAAAACQSKARDRRPMSAIGLIREDLGLFTQDVLKIFKDRDPKTSEAKEKTALDVLKGDLNLFKNELTTFTGDISGILRKGLRKEDNIQINAEKQRHDDEKDNCEEEEQEGGNGKEAVGDQENEKTFGISAGEQDEQSEGIEKGEARETKAREQQESGESVDRSCGVKDPEKSGDVEKGDSNEAKALSVNGDEEKDNTFDLKAQNGTKDKEENGDEIWEEGWELVELEQNGRTLNGNEEEAETDADESVPCADHLTSLSSGVGLLRLRSVTINQQWGDMKDDTWAIKNFAQYLTLDPNTANPELLLSNGNRTARREWSGHVTHQLSDHMTEHPERFEHCPQVLCREGLLDAVYWEVQWTGGADVGVAYNSLSRRGPVDEGLLGQSAASWSLECSRGCYTPCHRRRRYKSVCPDPFSQTVGVFLDFAAGSLSFFCVSPGSMQHLHTFTAAFTEPLYPAFWLWSYGGSVSLSQVELGWERLLQ